MKTLLFLSALLIPLLGFSQNHKTEFKVYGSCPMCETRIERAAKSAAGVNSAAWNLETQMLTIEYDAGKVSLDDVHKKIAESGHDTDKMRARDEVYQSLPACCRYERPSGNNIRPAVKEGGSCCTR